MIKSMTGYGSAEGVLSGVTYAVEIRTVNNRYFKANIRLPEPVAFLEEDIDKVLRRELSRGMVSYTLRLKDLPVEVFYDLDEKALASLVRRLGRISAEGVACEVDVGSLLALPGILVPARPDKKTAERVRRKVLAITREALKGLKAMRAAEGAALAADLQSHCRVIKRNLARICARSTAGPVQYGRKLKKRVDELLAGAKVKLDDEVIAREVAIFADRSDISEETARLDSHLEQFARALAGNSQAGRKLDFISQEMLREANTVASKAADANIVHWVVDIKCAIDRIKEQVQNVE